MTSLILSRFTEEGVFGSQIDMLIARKDQVINLCEMKYSGSEYTIYFGYTNILGGNSMILRPDCGRFSVGGAVVINNTQLLMRKFFDKIGSTKSLRKRRMNL